MARGIGGEIGSCLEHSDVLGDGRLLKELLRPGSGLAPELGDVAKIRYTCRLASREEILDSSEQQGGPFDFTIGESEVILGLEHAVTSMHVGELATFTVHPDLALGLAGCGGGMVPPNMPSSPAPSGEADMDCTSGAGTGTLQLQVELLGVGRQDEAHPEGLSQEERLQRAMKAKESGNVSFKAGLLEPAADEYELALQCLGLATKSSTSESPAPAATEEDTQNWDDAPRNEARNKLALSCFLNLAQCELRLSRYMEAQEHAGMALSLDPENSKAIYRRGVAALGVGSLEMAKADLVEAVRREPRSAEVRAQLQECQRRLQASEKKDRSTFGGMFDRSKVSLYGEKSEARPQHVLGALTQIFLQFGGDSLEFLPEGGRLEFALFSDTVPKAAENFRLLCTGERGVSASSGRTLCYRGSRVHRLAKGSLLQAGDIGPAGDGTGGENAIGGTLKDELLNEKLDRRGLLGMSNLGPDTIGSQFFITLAEAPHLDGSFVIVGELVSGSAVLAALERLAVNEKEELVQPCRIIDCGVCSGGGSSVVPGAQPVPSAAEET